MGLCSLSSMIVGWLGGSHDSWSSSTLSRGCRSDSTGSCRRSGSWKESGGRVEGGCKETVSGLGPSPHCVLHVCLESCIWEVPLFSSLKVQMQNRRPSSLPASLSSRDTPFPTCDNDCVSPFLLSPPGPPQPKTTLSHTLVGGVLAKDIRVPRHSE